MKSRNKLNKTSIAITSVMLLSALFLIWFRGGLLSWAGLGISIAVLVKLTIKPNSSDIKLCLGGLVTWGAGWGFAAYLVFSGWESGEVIELLIETEEGSSIARTWIVDSDETPVMIYVTNMATIKALQSQEPVLLTRDGKQTQRRPYLTLAEEADADYLNNIYSLIEDKYGSSNNSTTIYFQWMGSPRNREIAIIELRPL